MNVNNEGLKHLQWQIAIYYTDDGKVAQDVSFPQNQSITKSDTRVPNSIWREANRREQKWKGQPGIYLQVLSIH